MNCAECGSSEFNITCANCDGLEDEKIVIDINHISEALERVEMAREIIDSSIYKHVAIQMMPYLGMSVENVQDALSELHGFICNEIEKLKR